MEQKFIPIDYSAYLQQHHRLILPDVWVEQRPIAMLLMYFARPDSFIKLGQQSGNSYHAFCQAVDELALQTKCFVIDAWVGDEHAGEYGSEVLINLPKHHNPFYNHFSTLIQTTFDEANIFFDKGAFDLLRI